MTTTRISPPGSPTPTRAIGPLTPVIAAAAAALGVGALFLPDVTSGGDMDGMSVTHYMGLLGANQPWNLIVFMALPVILAETLAITELVLLFSKNPPAYVRSLSRWAGLVVGPLMVGIGVYLLKNAVIPLTTGAGWRGAADVIAVLAYLLGAVPLIGITLVELGVIGRSSEREARKLHVTFVGFFLVVAHVAMIVGMLDPTVLGWNPEHVMPGGGTMPGMNH
jgi:hypothetical protein